MHIVPILFHLNKKQTQDIYLIEKKIKRSKFSLISSTVTSLLQPRKNLLIYFNAYYFLFVPGLF